MSSSDNEFWKNFIRHVELPNRWPALESMLVDDQNRLWVATIVDDIDTSQWWVLDARRRLLARFTWPRRRQIEMIKGQDVYIRQTEDETGLQQIVRYRMVIN